MHRQIALVELLVGTLTVIRLAWMLTDDKIFADRRESWREKQIGNHVERFVAKMPNLSQLPPDALDKIAGRPLIVSMSYCPAWCVGFWLSAIWGIAWILSPDWTVTLSTPIAVAGAVAVIGSLIPHDTGIGRDSEALEE